MGSIGLLLAAMGAIALTSRRAMDRRVNRADRRRLLPVTAAGLFAAAAGVQVVWRMGHSLLPWERVEILLLIAATAVAVGAVAVCWVPARAFSGRARVAMEPLAASTGVYPGFSYATIVRSLVTAVDIRDRYTHSHSRMVSELSAATAEVMGLRRTDVDRVRVGALLHDVGKIGVPDAILSKRGRLTEDEWESVRMHPALGKTIMEQAPELDAVIPLVLHHQEHYDGSGYPARLSGRQIPLGARIIAVADAYHAMRSDRPYRSARTHAEAVPELFRCSGTQFDPEVVSALLLALDTDRRLHDMVFATDPSSPGLPYTDVDKGSTAGPNAILN
jgi:putative nucleotidyltransferase with HDIG domain